MQLDYEYVNPKEFPQAKGSASVVNKDGSLRYIADEGGVYVDAETGEEVEDLAYDKDGNVFRWLERVRRYMFHSRSSFDALQGLHTTY